METVDRVRAAGPRIEAVLAEDRDLRRAVDDHIATDAVEEATRR